jgi:hypothetical protein
MHSPRSIFTRLLMRQHAQEHLTLHQLKQMLRAMTAYRQGMQVGELIQTPRIARDSVWLACIWAGQRLAYEQPGVFVGGLVCMVPALILTVYQVGRLVWRLVVVVLGGVAS